MASQFIKNRAFIQKLKEPEVMDVDFNLEDSALDYSIESLEEDILPEAKPVELFEEREKVRTERLSDTLTKIGGGLMDESIDFIKREEFKLGSPGTPLTKEQVQAIVDSYNDYKKQKGALPNIINVIDNFTAKQKKILGVSGNPYRVKKILE